MQQSVPLKLVPWLVSFCLGETCNTLASAENQAQQVFVGDIHCDLWRKQKASVTHHILRMIAHEKYIMINQMKSEI